MMELKLRHAIPNSIGLLTGCVAISAALVSPYASAASVPDYMIITTMEAEDGDAFIMSDSEIGAIGPNFQPAGSTSPPGSLPTLPGGTERTVSEGITRDGDVAVTRGGTVNIDRDGTVTLSNSDVHAINTGPVNPGSQGIDCGSSFATCTDNGSQISSNNRFNPSIPESFTALGENNGIQGNIDHTDILDELEVLRTNIDGGPATGSIDLTPTGQIQNTNEIWDFSGGGSGLQIFDILTGPNDFYIVNSNLTIKGDADDILIFRLGMGHTMNVSESNLLLDGGIGDNNVLFYVDADESEESFNFDNVTFQGMALWDLGLDTENVISFNNVQFCGQLITDQVNLQNTSGSGCEFDTSVVPVPAAIWLFGSALIGMVGFNRRSKSA